MTTTKRSWRARVGRPVRAVAFAAALLLPVAVGAAANAASAPEQPRSIDQVCVPPPCPKPSHSPKPSPSPTLTPSTEPVPPSSPSPSPSPTKLRTFDLLPSPASATIPPFGTAGDGGGTALDPPALGAGAITPPPESGWKPPLTVLGGLSVILLVAGNPMLRRSTNGHRGRP